MSNAESSPCKLCECGCGQPAPIAKRTSKRYGHVKGQPVRFISGHQWKTPEARAASSARAKQYTGKNNPKWKGGMRTHSNGYLEVRQPDGSYRYLHRMLAEHRLARALRRDEVVDTRTGEVMTRSRWAKRKRLNETTR